MTLERSKQTAELAIDYSFVIPVYFNAGSLDQVYTEIKQKIFSAFPDRRGEIIFIDDGSGDDSYTRLKALRENDRENVRVIKLTRNFGQPSARLCGLRQARGRCIISMAADGQDPIDLALDMIHGCLDEQKEVIICRRTGRDESYVRKITSRVFFWLMRKLCFTNMPTGGFSYVMLGRKALNALLRNQESTPYFQGQILWTGFDVHFLDYHRPARSSGESRWTFGKKITLLLDGVLNYSFLPIRLISLSGILASLVGVAFTLAVVARRIWWGTMVPGWTTITLLLLVIGGLQMVMLGIIGEYLWRTLAQVRNRDAYVVEEEAA